jgi:hypothetical protein
MPPNKKTCKYGARLADGKCPRKPPATRKNRPIFPDNLPIQNKMSINEEPVYLVNFSSDYIVNEKRYAGDDYPHSAYIQATYICNTATKSDAINKLKTLLCQRIHERYENYAYDKADDEEGYLENEAAFFVREVEAAFGRYDPRDEDKGKPLSTKRIETLCKYIMITPERGFLVKTLPNAKLMEDTLIINTTAWDEESTFYRRAVQH